MVSRGKNGNIYIAADLFFLIFSSRRRELIAPNWKQPKYFKIKALGCLSSFLYACLVCAHARHVQLFAALWTVALQAPLSMELSRQEYWGG